MFKEDMLRKQWAEVEREQGPENKDGHVASQARGIREATFETRRGLRYPAGSEIPTSKPGQYEMGRAERRHGEKACLASQIIVADDGDDGEEGDDKNGEDENGNDDDDKQR
ncbi:hypothetical protein CCHR01_15234 [Colletotrichum chrysophilum]|uniref:Uncharacterized protein n=1 Tax=Colletotrichum chrysophilum TaxID=1836956 RepID=A0AAD9EBZ8_9PEZI|nr:hypothetical protein CCHR01_15234 [Colletotrichum chrysophilum]